MQFPFDRHLSSQVFPQTEEGFMPWLEITKTLRPRYPANKRWRRARLRTVLKKMVDIPASQALLCELKAASGKVLRCQRLPRGLGAGG